MLKNNLIPLVLSVEYTHEKGERLYKDVKNGCFSRDAVLDDKSCDWNQGENQHMENEELLSVGSCWVDVVTADPPDCILHTLHRKSDCEANN